MPASHPRPGARLLRADGALVVPPQLAAEVARILADHLDDRARLDGGHLTPGARWLIAGLQDAARGPEQPLAATGFRTETTAAGPATLNLTARQAAELLECSPQYVRRLARTGKLPAHRAGRAWLIDPGELHRYRTREPTPEDSP